MNIYACPLVVCIKLSLLKLNRSYRLPINVTNVYYKYNNYYI